MRRNKWSPDAEKPKGGLARLAAVSAICALAVNLSTTERDHRPEPSPSVAQEVWPGLPKTHEIQLTPEQQADLTQAAKEVTLQGLKTARDVAPTRPGIYIASRKMPFSDGNIVLPDGTPGKKVTIDEITILAAPMAEGGEGLLVVSSSQLTSCFKQYDFDYADGCPKGTNLYTFGDYFRFAVPEDATEAALRGDGKLSREDIERIIGAGGTQLVLSIGRSAESGTPGGYVQTSKDSAIVLDETAEKPSNGTSRS